MIGVDTNVLLRLFVNDNEEQHRAARAWFQGRSSADPAYVCMVVMLEFMWSLRKTYGYPREEVYRMVSGLLEADDVRVERADLVSEAVGLAGEGRGEVPDVLVALLGRAAGCAATLTFDKVEARKIPGMQLLS